MSDSADTLDYYLSCICCLKGPSLPFYENADYYGFTMSCYNVLTSAFGRLCQHCRLPTNLPMLPQNSIKSLTLSLHRFIKKNANHSRWWVCWCKGKSRQNISTMRITIDYVFAAMRARTLTGPLINTKL